MSSHPTGAISTLGGGGGRISCTTCASVMGTPLRVASCAAHRRAAVFSPRPVTPTRIPCLLLMTRPPVLSCTSSVVRNGSREQRTSSAGHRQPDLRTRVGSPRHLVLVPGRRQVEEPVH